MKRSLIVSIFLSVIALVFVGVIVFSRETTAVPVSTPSPLGGCEKIGTEYKIEIFSDSIFPKEIKARPCDKLIFINTDEDLHQIALGSHPDHIYYPGLEEKILRKGEVNELILTEEGEYEIHDHINPEIEGSLQIVKN